MTAATVHNALAALGLPVTRVVTPNVLDKASWVVDLSDEVYRADVEAFLADFDVLTVPRRYATEQICVEIDRRIAISGLMPQSNYSGEMVSDIAFMVQLWQASGEPETMPAAIADRVESEAAIYGLSPSQMIGIWAVKWQEMRDGLSPILAQRRAWLLAVETAETIEDVEAVISELSE